MKTGKNEIVVLLEVRLAQISKVLKENYLSNQNIGVLAGISGIALFHFYYSRYTKKEAPADTAMEILEEMIKRINQGYQFPTFCSGIAGAAWVLDHLASNQLLDSDNDSLLSDLDPFLYEIMVAEIKKGNYDFLHAGMGYAWYFLQAYGCTKDPNLEKKYLKYLKEFLKYLKNLAIPDANGYKWVSVLDQEKKIKTYNLSLSHGISGIVIFLSKLSRITIFKKDATALLKGATSYLLSCQNKTEGFALFPHWVPLEGHNTAPSRLAWCYGDLGIALALWHAAEALNDTVLRVKAIHIFEHTCQRRKIEETFARDAPICHGSFGMVQIYSFIYRKTGKPLFKETADYWLRHGLKMGNHKNGYAGFKKYDPQNNMWENETDLLEGVAGIGLTMIDYLTEEEHNWDECLMIH